MIKLELAKKYPHDYIMLPTQNVNLFIKIFAYFDHVISPENKQT